MIQLDKKDVVLVNKKGFTLFLISFSILGFECNNKNTENSTVTSLTADIIN